MHVFELLQQLLGLEKLRRGATGVAPEDVLGGPPSTC